MSYIEERNYANDFRVAALGKSQPWLENINPERMTAQIEIEHYLDLDPDFPEGGSKETPTVFLKWEVCPTCEGRGKHVNPSIDCGGLTHEDFADDPDFVADYRAGVYDVPCYECKGRTTVLAIDEKHNDEALNKAIERWADNRARDCYAERMERAYEY